MWPEVETAQQSSGKIALIEIGGNISNRLDPDTRSQGRYFLFCEDHLQAFYSSGILKEFFY
jgi:hypothetical protein